MLQAFLSEVFAKLSQIMRLSRTTSAPYSHQQNAIVERVIRTIRERLEELKAKHPTMDWSILAPIAQRAINAVPHTATGFPPAVLTFGRNIFSPASMIDPSVTVEEAWLQELQNAQTTANAQAKRNLQDHAEEKESSNKVSYVHKFLKDDWVLRKKQESNSKGSLDRTTYDGPFQVTRQEGNVVFYKTARSKVERRGFIKHFKPYHVKEGTNPLLEQIRKYSEWGIIEKVVDHFFVASTQKRKNKATLMFRIKWLEDDNIYIEPATNDSVFRNTVVRHYMSSQSELQQLINDT